MQTSPSVDSAKSTSTPVPFNHPDLTSTETAYVIEALRSGKISGDGSFTKRVHEFLGAHYGCSVLLVHSCTAALEMSALLADLKPGDEVIMPSFTFVSTANAVVLRGAIPVFVDIRPDTLNIDERLIAAAITERTRAIMPVHYAGVGAAMREILTIAKAHKLLVIEDAAQGYEATYDDLPLGRFGDLGCLSFHETKNVVSGEGGALLINNPELVDRAQYIREKGTNRTQFLQRYVSKYEWVDLGSSYLPSDILAALLLAQLERAPEITARRRAIWNRYYNGLKHLADAGFSLPQVPANAVHNGHIFYLMPPKPEQQQPLLKSLAGEQISATSHYVPLHNSPAGLKYSRAHGDLPVTVRVGSSIVRLPVFAGMSDAQVDRVIERVVYHAARVAG